MLNSSIVRISKSSSAIYLTESQKIRQDAYNSHSQQMLKQSLVHLAPREFRVQRVRRVRRVRQVRQVRWVLQVIKAKMDPQVSRVRLVPQGQPDLPGLKVLQVQRALMAFPGLLDPREVVANAD